MSLIFNRSFWTTVMCTSLFLQMLTTMTSSQPVQTDAPNINDYASTQWMSRSVWDMAVQDGVLYIGGGDYTNNTGPINVWAYDLQTRQWEVSGTLEEEAVCRFIQLDGNVVAPGIDSTEDTWTYGNYHTLIDGQWITSDPIPGAVHNFDVVRHKGSLFFGLGSDNGSNSPVLVSADGKNDFNQVPFYKDGVPVLGTEGLSFSRAYDLLQIEDRLYCLLACTYTNGATTYEFYQHTDAGFVYTAAPELKFVKWKQIPVFEKTTVGAQAYFTTGVLYKTEDFTTFEKVDLPANGAVTDIYLHTTSSGKQILYALHCSVNPDGTYRNTVYRIGDKNTAVAQYTAQCPGLSLVRYGYDFYIGLGGGVALTDDVGTVAKVSVFSEMTLWPIWN